MNRLQALFATAAVGVLVAVGVAISSLGWVPAAVYAVAVVVALATVRERARAQRGHTCTCCSSTVHDPVEVV